MTLIFADGFDQYGNDRAQAAQIYDTIKGLNGGAGNVSIETGSARTGTGDLLIGDNGFIQKVFPAPQDKVIIGFGLYGIGQFMDWTPRGNYGTGTLQIIAAVMDVNGYHATVRVDSVGRLSIGCGGRFTAPNSYDYNELAQSPINVVQPNQWYWIECAFALSADGVANSEVAVRVNGALVIDYQGAMTTSGGYGDPVSTLHGPAQAWMAFEYGDNKPFRIDDLVMVSGADFPGDRRCVVLLPDADTPQADWALNNVAAGFDALNNMPADDTKFISAANVGAISTFDLADLPPNASSALGMMLYSRTIKSDAGNAKTRAGFATGGNLNNAPEISAPAGGFAWNAASIGDNPLTGQPYTVAEINAGSLAITRTA